MIFTSTRDSSLSVKFSEAVNKCIPGDGGVFIPSPNSIVDLRRWIYYINERTTFKSIAGTLTSAFIQDEFSPIICEKIATEAFPFEPVITQLEENLFHMDLSNGYTGCHRDYGVSYLCSYLNSTNTLLGRKSLFLDFTHGEMGPLLAKNLRGKKNIKAILVYQKGTVRGLEEEDLFWNGGNIYPVEVEGSEEQIKEMISSIFEDKEFVQKYNLTVSNTTNICRLLAQVFYYPYSFSRIKNKVDGDIYYACDAGNYAALMAGLYSWRFSMPLSGIFLPSTEKLSCSEEGEPVLLDSAIDKKMDINPTYPANLERLESFFENNKLMMKHFVFPSEVSKKQNEAAAKELYKKYNLFADSETASAYAVIKEYQDEVMDDGGAFVLISQNHPSLSSDYCKEVIGKVPEMPENILKSLKKVNLNRQILNNSEDIRKIIKSI